MVNDKTNTSLIYSNSKIYCEYAECLYGEMATHHGYLVIHDDTKTDR